MNYRIEVVAIDCLMVRLFDHIDESNMPWLLAASQRLRSAFAGRLVDLVPSYTTLMVHFDLLEVSPAEAQACIREALSELQPDAGNGGRQHEIPVWYDLSVGPELKRLAERCNTTGADIIRRH